jgi:hypothetical protein
MLTDDDKKWLLDTFATKEDLERIETRLLTEFQKWASPIEQRMRSHREALRTLDLEGEEASDALKRIEARLKELGGER